MYQAADTNVILTGQFIPQIMKCHSTPEGTLLERSWDIEGIWTLPLLKEVNAELKVS